MHMCDNMDTHTHKHTRIHAYNLPSLPRTHTLSVPAVVWYLPATQSVQTVAALDSEYFPASQLVQTDSD